MSEPKIAYLEYVGPAAIFVGGAALTAATGGASVALGAGALIGMMLTSLGPNLIASIMQRKAEARASARDFALNDTLARAFGRAAGALAAAIARKAQSAGDRKDASSLQSLAKGFEELWVSEMHLRYYKDLEEMNGQDLARVFSKGLARRAGLPVSAATWRSLIASFGMPVADQFGVWQIKAEWIDQLIDKLVSSELTEAFARELSHKSEAAAKITMRLLAELQAGAIDPAVTADLDDEEKSKLETILRDIEPKFTELSRQLKSLEQTVREEGMATREVIRTATDEVKGFINETLAPGSLPFELPSAALGGFVGRGRELDLLVARLREGRNTSVVAFAGMGKTALAAEALHAVVPDREAMAASKFPDGIVFLDLYTYRGDAKKAWGSLANSLKGGKFEQNAADENRAREACRKASFLLIVEGAEEADGLEGRVTLEALLSVLTPQNRWLVLTRNIDQTLPAERIEIREELSEKDAATLFESLLGATEIEPALRDRVLTLLEGHPLAITWAAGLLGQGLDDPVDLADDWEAAELPPIHDPKESGGQRSLRWLFERSDRRLTADQRRVLHACGLLARAPIPREAIEAIYPDARPLLAALARRSLLRRSRMKGNWEFTHALAYRFARDQETLDPDLVSCLGNWIGRRLGNDLGLDRGGQDLDDVSALLIHATALVPKDEKRSLWDNLVNPMLYEQLDRIRVLGRLDLVFLALAAVADWLARLPTEPRDEPTWQRDLSVSRDRLGALAVSRGQLEEAQEHFAAGKEIAERLAQADPSNAEWQRDLSVSRNKLGALAVSRGQLEEAQEHFAAGKEIRELLAQADPSNAEWQRDLSVSRNKLGDLAVSRGQLEEAQEHFAAGKEIAERLAQADPSNAAWQRDLSVSRDWLGDLAVSRGQLEEAQEHFAAGKEIRERLAQADPSNAEWQRDLSVSRDRLGDLAVSRGQLEEAQEHFAAGKEIAERLAQADPSNAEWQRDLSVSRDRLGALAVSRGQLEEAQEHFAAGKEIRERLAQADPSNAEWRRDLSVSRDWLGDLAVSRGQLEEAQEHFAAGKEIAERLAQADPSNAEWQRDLVVSHAKTARVAAALGDEESEKKALRDCFAVLEGMRKRSLHFDPSLERFYHQLVERLGLG